VTFLRRLLQFGLPFLLLINAHARGPRIFSPFRRLRHRPPRSPLAVPMATHSRAYSPLDCAPLSDGLTFCLSSALRGPPPRKSLATCKNFFLSHSWLTLRFAAYVPLLSLTLGNPPGGLGVTSEAPGPWTAGVTHSKDHV